MNYRDLTTRELYDRLLQYFDVRELVSPKAYRSFQHRGDYFFLSRFDRRLLVVILWIRETTGRKIYVNNWAWGGRFDERGLRDNLTSIVLDRVGDQVVYLSGHALAMALDYDVEGMTAVEHRDWLDAHAEQLPYPIRLENKLNGEQISWTHLDVCDDPRNPKVYRFNI